MKIKDRGRVSAYGSLSTAAAASHASKKRILVGYLSFESCGGSVKF